MKKRFIGVIAGIMAASMVFTTIDSNAAGDRPPKKPQTEFKAGYDSTELMHGEALTEDELTQIGEFLSDRENNGFVMSSYRTPEKINWGQVFYGGAGFKNCEYSQEALNAYLKKNGYDSVEFDLIALSGKDVRSFIKAKTGITNIDMRKLGLTYIESEDVLFSQVSDTNYNHIHCEEGVRNGRWIQVEVCGEMGYIGDVGYYRRITLIDTGNPDNPYMFYSSRELWEEYADPIEGYNYVTDKKTYFATENYPAGIKIWVIEDNTPVAYSYPFYSNEEMKQYEEAKEIAICDANGDGVNDVIAVISNGKKSVGILCLGYIDDWGRYDVGGTKDSVTKWLNDNVADMTTENMNSYINAHQSELKKLIG